MSMKDKFISYVREAGMHQALRYAKYDGISLALCLQWIEEELGAIHEKERAIYALIYSLAPARHTVAKNTS